MSNKGNHQYFTFILVTLLCFGVYFYLSITQEYQSNELNITDVTTNQIFTKQITILSKEKEKNTTAFVPKDLKCLSGVVYANGGTGRLGNCLMESASAWVLAKVHNLTPVVQDNIYSSIASLLSDVPVVSATKFLNELNETDISCALVAKKVFSKPSSFYTKIHRPLDDAILKHISKGPIVLSPLYVLIHELSHLRSALKEDYIYKPEFHYQADQTLKNASQELNCSALPGKIVYIGVHARRTDYQKHLSRKLHIPKREFAGLDYFIRAADYLVKELGKKGMFKFLFAVSSDDREWSTKELIPALRNHFEFLKPKTNAVAAWCGSEDYRRDLVLLSSCNHTIISYGTFATWASLMAGGLTVVFDVDSFGKDSIHSAMGFAKLLNWTTLA